MRALLLAAGLGTRLRPITDTVPKCLVSIKGKPLLEYWLELLINEGVHPVLINTHYHADKVSAYLETSIFKNMINTTYEETLLGTAGTLYANREFFGTETLMLVHADNLSRFDVKAFIHRHMIRPSECEMTMMTFHTTEPSACGIVELNEQGVVKAFHEKVSNPQGNRANGAVYILEPTIFSFLEGLGKRVIDFSTEVLPFYVGRIFTFHNDVYHRDIGTVESYNKANHDYC